MYNLSYNLLCIPASGSGCGFPGAPAHSTVTFSPSEDEAREGTIAEYSCDRWATNLSKAFTIFVLQGFWATWTSATGVRDKRHLVTPGNPVLRWGRGGIFSICFTFSVFCLINNPRSRYILWTWTRSQVKRSQHFHSCVDIIFGTLFYPLTWGTPRILHVFMFCFSFW